MLAGALVPAAATAQDLPEIQFEWPWHVTEGDSGITPATVAYTLSAPSTSDVSFRYAVSQEFELPGEPADVVVEDVLVVIPAGETSGEFPLQIVGDRIVEPIEPMVYAVVGELAGATIASGSSTSTGLRITDDDERLKQPRIVRDDVSVVSVNYAGPYANLHPLRNDTYDPYLGYRISVVSPPAHGLLDVVGTAVYYFPYTDFHGDDHLRLRICLANGTDCRESDYLVQVRPWVNAVSATQRSDRELVTVNLPAMDSITYEATALAAPRRELLIASPDFTPESPWNDADGVAYVTTELPALASGSLEHRITVGAERGTDWHYMSHHVDLQLGIDENGDGKPSEGETACSTALVTGEYLVCELRVVQGTTPVRWWAMLHNRDQAFDSRTFVIHDVSMVDSGGSFVATGPGRRPAGGPTPMTIAWDDPTFVYPTSRRGYLMLRESPGAEPVLVHMHVGGGMTGDPPIPLRSGKARDIALAPAEQHRRTWFDVPAGATSLTVTARSDSEVDYYLVRQQDAIDPVSTDIPEAPAIDAAVATADGAGGDATMVVDGAALAPGRWYVVPTNLGDAVADVRLRVNIVAVAPVVRPGSYFNAARPGSGLFVYPAGDQLTGLWYTYRNELRGSPAPGTWYYLQATAPGSDGIWRAPVFRGTWNGTSRTLTRVGEAALTPTDDDAFLFSYTLEGRSGSQPMAALGRGCPTIDGQAIDASGQWFDPARAGTGYSAQFWNHGYEYFAAYVYDVDGEPVFLPGEREGSSASGDAVLQRLRGACPTCAHDPSFPLREDVGTMTRHVAGGTLDRIEVDALVGAATDAAAVDWLANDDVQPLGLTQGCD
jgi:hypothetical protein